MSGRVSFVQRVPRGVWHSGGRQDRALGPISGTVLQKPLLIEPSGNLRLTCVAATRRAAMTRSTNIMGLAPNLAGSDERSSTLRPSKLMKMVSTGTGGPRNGGSNAVPVEASSIASSAYPSPRSANGTSGREPSKKSAPSKVRINRPAKRRVSPSFAQYRRRAGENLPPQPESAASLDGLRVKTTAVLSATALSAGFAARSHAVADKRRAARPTSLTAPFIE